MTAADHTPSPATDGLREAVEALAADFRSEIDWSNGRSNYGDNEAWEQAARRVDDILAAHPAPPSETAPVLDGPSFGDYWPPSEAATEDESVRRYLDRVESVTTNESVLSVIREIRGELAASSDEETQP